MTKTADTPTVLPELDIKLPGEATADLPAADEAILSALMIRALRAHADSVAGDRQAHSVSVSVDLTGTEFQGGDLRFLSEVDRQTRTLVFMNGTLRSGESVLLKATAIFRLSEAG